MRPAVHPCFARRAHARKSAGAIAWLGPATLCSVAALLTSCGGGAGGAANPVGSSTGTGPTPVSNASWELVWADEFDTGAIDSSKWGFDVDCWGGGNNERQCYTDRSENARVEGGNLVITARREDYTGFALPESQRSGAADPNAMTTKPFTSARLVTRGKANWQYGRIEFRARLPQGQGTWPALWMLPEDYAYGGWAASGEIDVVEAVNLGVDCASCAAGKRDSIFGTLHFGGEWPDNASSGAEFAYPPVLDGFHTYTLIWNESAMHWLVDGQEFSMKDQDDWYTTGSSDPRAPFDKPFHIIINLAIGGNFPENRDQGGVSLDGYPKTMEVDWVRVYQCSDPASGGANCPIEGGAS